MNDRHKPRDCVVSTGFEPPNEITVLFDDRALSFPMSASATLADVAVRLVEANVPLGQMLSVTVKLGGTIGGRRQSRRQETPWPTSRLQRTGLRSSDRLSEYL